MLANQCTDTRILTREHHPQVLCLVLRIILCIRIQTTEHRIDTCSDRLLGVQRIHIQEFEVLIHLIEDIQMLAHLEVMILALLCRGRHCHQAEHQQRYDISFHFLPFYFFTFI